MSLLAATLKLDVRLQARSNLYGVGIAIAVLLGLLGRFLIGPDRAANAVPMMYLLGLGGTAYFFPAALVISEKTQGTLTAMRTTPLTNSAYMSSKVITLTLFAACEGLIIHAIGFWGVPFNPIPLVAGLVGLGAFLTLVGLGQSAGCSSVTAFLFPWAMVVGSTTQLPVLYVLGLGPPMLWYLIPTQAPLLLFRGSFVSLETWQWVYAVGVTAGSVIVAAIWARRQFAIHVELQQS